MEMIFVSLVILQSLAISLGVGSSTIAIASFFVAISDGSIEPTERKLLGVVYTVLRVGMVLALLTTIFLAVMHITSTDLPYITPFTSALWTLIGVLFANAILMTKHIMPSNIGPAVQAGTWYTLGVIMVLIPLGLDRFSYFEFFIGYAAALALALAIVNGIMGYFKKKRSAQAQ